MRREIPDHARNIQRVCLFIISGLVPFIAISVQFTQISSMFKQIIQTRGLQRRHNQILDIFRIGYAATSKNSLKDYNTAMIFAMVAFILYIVIVAEVAVVQTYIQLCREDYRWWWRSFYVGASSGIYLFLLGLFTMSFNSVISSQLA